MAIAGTPLSVLAADGYEIAATRYDAASPVAVVVLAGGTGVPRRFYGRFARYLAERGLTVFTFDYRGIGESLRGDVRRCKAKMSDWGELDLPAVIEAAKSHRPDLPLLHVGHSTGGQILGLTDRSKDYAALLLIATQSGWSGLWRGWGRLRILSGWIFTIPLATLILRRLPGRLFGGEDLPSEVARQWARWGRRRNYILTHDPAVRGRFAAIRAPVRFIRIEGDFFGPRAAVEEIASWFGSQSKEFVDLPGRLADSDPDDPPLGHLGFFGGRAAAELWPAAAVWLLERVRAS